MALSRQLEPEAMDTPEDAAEYDSMDHGEVNRKFVDDLLQAFEVNGDILDLGTGTALIPIELCQRVKDCRVMAVDLAIEMLELAKFRVDVANLRSRIALAHVDAKVLPYEDGRFHLVMSNSILHHIPQPDVVIAEAIRVTAAGGKLFFRDLLRPDSEEQVEALAALHVANETDYARQMFIASLRAALTLDEVREMVKQHGFPADTVAQTSDRHWTWAATKSK